MTVRHTPRVVWLWPPTAKETRAARAWRQRSANGDSDRLCVGGAELVCVPQKNKHQSPPCVHVNNGGYPFVHFTRLDLPLAIFLALFPIYPPTLTPNSQCPSHYLQVSAPGYLADV